jgi:hypothetical protein
MRRRRLGTKLLLLVTLLLVLRTRPAQAQQFFNCEPVGWVSLCYCSQLEYMCNSLGGGFWTESCPMVWNAYFGYYYQCSMSFCSIAGGDIPPTQMAPCVW